MAAGRPTKYNSDFAEQAKKLCLMGLTDKELAKFFGVQVSTINNWKIDHPEFLESVNAGKTLADAEVASSFHRRALGYRYEEVTYEKIDIGEGFAVPGGDSDSSITSEVYKKKVVVKEIAPDAGAALNWLKNRQPGKWRDKQEIGVTDKNGKDVPAVTVFQLPDNGRGSS